MRIPIQTFVQLFCVLAIVVFSSTAVAQDDMEYFVITNKEGQHAIWSSKAGNPTDWTKSKYHGTLKQCSDYIEEVWTDMRPLSMQKKYKKKMKDGYVVIINHEEQYMIWPREEYVPDEWGLAGAGGSYTDCKAYIEEVWTDMRPLSLRKRLGG